MDEDDERRRRRDERRARHASETPKSSRHKSAPVDSYFDPRNGSKREKDAEYLPADGLVYKDSKRKKSGWPHEGTNSWIQDHSDAPPPPEDAPPVNREVADDTIADENARRNLRKTRRHSKYDDAAEEDPEERRRRRESRRRERDAMKSSEGSQGDGRRSIRRDSGFVDVARAASAQGGLFSRWKKIAGV